MMVDTHTPSAVAERVRDLCRQFKLPTLAAETVGRFSQAGHTDALVTLVEVMEQEAEDRRIRRVDRLRRASKLPAGKTWDTFEHDRTPIQLRQQLGRLGEGDFADRGVNVLAFGMPGTGKTHAMCAIGHRLVESGRSVLFIPAYRLVQDMLAAKRDLELPRMLRKLDNFDLLVIDDLGYLPQGAEESEVLFTLIAERYERRSLGITSNLVFSEWEKVFANPMATAAAIDRIVHHSVILEFDVPSLQDECGTESSGKQGVRPARIIDAPDKMVDVDHRIFNTDQGAQFRSGAFTGLLEANSIEVSMDGKSRCVDNVFIERLWRTVKYEEVYLKAYASGSQARAGPGAYFDFYNRSRPHQALGYKTPAEVYTGQPEATAQDEATTILADRVTGYSATAGLKLNLATDLS